MDSETLLKIEEQRLKLEENLAKLKKSLRHWQTLELDYDALREEFFPLKEKATASECLHAAQQAGSDLLTDSELHSLLNDDKGIPRRPFQIVELLAKRSEYVARNINSLRKQISEVEKNRNALLLSKDPDLQEDAGLPLSEVIEELDDDGNVISSRINHPAKDTSQLVNVLQKAGVKGLKGEADSETSDKIVDAVDTESKDQKKLSNIPDEKVVKTLQGHSPPNELPDSSQDASNATAKKNDDILSPTNPSDTAEDALLRQEMLQYGLDEVGHIVAELELTEIDKASQNEYEDEDEDDDMDNLDEDEEDESDVDEEEDSEDESGRTKRPVISAGYRKRMEDLQKRLGIKNLGPDPNLPVRLREEIDRPPAAEAARKAAIARAEATQAAEAETGTNGSGSTEKPVSKRKKVAFASELDIAPEQKPPSATIQPASAQTVTEDVVERTVADSKSQAISTQPKPISKFKAARSGIPQTPMLPPPMDFPSPTTSNPEGPAGKTIADNLVERHGAKHALEAPPPDGDEFDDKLHKREVALEYHKLRNKKIHEHGGYVGGGEQDNYGDEVAAVTVVDEASGRPRKISRFKAARMKP